LLRINTAKVFKINLNLDCVIVFVSQQKFSIISSTHGLFWVEIIVNYYENPKWEYVLEIEEK
jgi:hypothetical protein